MALEIWPKIGLSGKIRLVASYCKKKLKAFKITQVNVKTSEVHQKN